MKTIALPDDLYTLLKNLKYELKRDTMRAVISDLVKEHRLKREVKK